MGHDIQLAKLYRVIAGPTKNTMLHPARSSMQINRPPRGPAGLCILDLDLRYFQSREMNSRRRGCNNHESNILCSSI